MKMIGLNYKYRTVAGDHCLSSRGTKGSTRAMGFGSDGVPVKSRRFDFDDRISYLPGEGWKSSFEGNFPIRSRKVDYGLRKNQVRKMGPKSIFLSGLEDEQ